MEMCLNNGIKINHLKRLNVHVLHDSAHLINTNYIFGLIGLIILYLVLLYFKLKLLTNTASDVQPIQSVRTTTTMNSHW